MTLEDTNDAKRAINDSIAAGETTVPDDAAPRKTRGRKKKEQVPPAAVPPTPAPAPETETPGDEDNEPETVPRNSIGNQVLKCECGADIMPDATGMYPAFCPVCGSENDYRGVDFLRASPDILVCDRCGHLTKMPAEKCGYCGWDGSIE